MQEQRNSIRIKRKTILYFVVFLIALAGVTPALADYIGPLRVVTEEVSVCKVILNECQYVTAKGEWRYHQIDSWPCSSESKPWQAYPSNSPSCNSGNDNYKYWEREDTTQVVTNTYAPATVGSSLQGCTLNNGWCTTASQLSLSANEPVAGYNILAIEGTLNGEIFACSNASCNVPLIEGDNNFTYWALSSWLDSSTMGTFSAKVDSQIPSISGTFTGTLGSNNWYIAPATFNGSASDATSGLASFTCTLDGVPLASCGSITVSNDGTHTLLLTARDNAGNTRTLTQNTSLDTQSPVLNASLSGTMGSNNWYTTAKLNATASDVPPGSGLSAFEYNLDTSGWINFPASGTLALSNGIHSVDLRAVDNAGLTVSSTKTFWLDTVAPNVTINSTGTLGLDDWHTTSLNLVASANDITSGMDIFEYSLDNGAWTAYSSALYLTDGAHSLSFWAQDSAGLVTQVNRIYKVDTRAPQISGSLSGVLGTNGWYISDVTISASASDPTSGSGLDTFTYILNGNAETPYTNAFTLSDGQHTVKLNADDKAGLTYSTEQIVKVDTLHPSLNMHTTLPNWIKNSIPLNGMAGDAGSGVAEVEISTDGRQTWQAVTGATSWSFNWNTADSPNGIHELHLRVVDHAGLTTEQTFNAGVDNHAPKIILPDSWFQWDTITLDIWDNHSGLSEARVEISDPQGRWPKRVIRLDPEGFPLDFKWDRRFGDNTTAPLGTYNVEVITFDNLGNMAHKSASIKILLGILPAGPTATPQPYSRTESTPTAAYTATHISSPTATQATVVSVFGDIEPTAQTTSTPVVMPTPRATPNQTSVLDWIESIFAPNANSTEQVTDISSLAPQDSDFKSANSQSNVLWGATAAAMIGAVSAYALEERRKQQEEKARQAALEAQAEEQREKMQARKMEKMDAQRAQEAAWEEAREEQARQAQDAYSAHMDAKMTRRDAEDDAKWAASQAVIKKRDEERKVEELQAGLAAYYNARKQGQALAQTQEKSWWEKTLNTIDNHQIETSIGIGAIVGVAAIAITLAVAVTVALPVILAVAGVSALVAGVAIGAGTIALNNHYDRDPMTNVWSNIKAGAVTAALVSGIGLFVFGGTLTQAVLKVGNTIGGWCYSNQTACARIEPILNALDTGEELWLSAKLGIQTATGNEVAAADTALEIQMEHMDGGMPGNALSKEIREQLAELGADAVHAIEKYGNDIIPLLLKYQGDALDIINTYDEEGIAILLKYGDKAIELIKDHGTPAVKLLRVVGPEAGKKLLNALDDDVLEYATQQGDDAVEALSRWSANDLKEHGVELALRAKKDAKVLSDVKSLIALRPIDPKHLTEEQRVLIDAIAANSTQYAGEGQVVLGKWVDISNGFVESAKDTGSVHYNPHPDMWNQLGGLGEENQSEVAWLINQQVVQTGINKGLPFEYTLNGVPAKTIENEQRAIKAIFSGKTDAEILDTLDLKVMPIRIKELQELRKAGYEIVFDEINNTYIFVLP